MNKAKIIFAALLTLGLTVPTYNASAKIVGMKPADTIVKVPATYSDQSNACYPNTAPGVTLKEKVDNTMDMLDANTEYNVKLTYRVDDDETISIGGYNIDKDLFIDSIYMIDKVCFLWSTKPSKGV